MAKGKIILATALIFFFTLSACNMQASGLSYQDAIDTAVAQTENAKNDIHLAVDATLTAMNNAAAPVDQTPAAEQPGGVPTATLTPSFTLTPTSGKVLVTVSKGTNCRTGPDVNFDLVIVFNTGETAEVVGKDAYGYYWIIQDPKNPAVTCWLWNKNATTTGDTSRLPVIDSPPTPTSEPGIITASSITVNHPVFHLGNCSNQFLTQSGKVSLTASGSLTVSFKLEDNSAYKGAFTEQFSSAGTQNFNFVYDLFSTCMVHTLKVIVTSPNNTEAQTTYSVVSP